MEWHEIIVSILSGLAMAIPLVIELVRYVKESVKEKNWGRLVTLVVQLIQDAELKFDNGTDRREWVMSMVQTSASVINYDVDLAVVGELIDNFCTMSKNVNITKEVIE